MQDSSDLDAVVSDFGQDASVFGEVEQQTPLQGDIIPEQENGSAEISVMLIGTCDRLFLVGRSLILVFLILLFIRAGRECRSSRTPEETTTH